MKQRLHFTGEPLTPSVIAWHVFLVTLATLAQVSVFAWSLAAQWSWWWYGGVLLFISMVTAARTGSAMKAVGLVVIYVFFGGVLTMANSLGISWAWPVFTLCVILLWSGVTL